LIVVRGLFVYPVKSCGGIAVDRAEIDAFGFRDDRRWMVVDGGGWFLTQRTVPCLATIRVGLSDGRLSLRAEGRDPLELDPVPADARRVPVTVWRDTVDALRAGDEADAWLSAVLGRPVQLVWMPPTSVRPAKRDPAGNGQRIAFADAYPLLVASGESLDDLNARLDTPLPMDRFRPNIVIEGARALVEDGWSRLWIGEVEFNGAAPCARCATTTVDQATGIKGVEPLRTLATFRRQGDQVLFGRYAVPRGAGEIQVGMPVEILEHEVPAIR
jgi:uncharacterized protein YcbX